jgi:hypothetical protein
VISGDRPQDVRRRLRSLAREFADAIAAGRGRPATAGAATGGPPSTREEIRMVGPVASSTGRTSWDAYVQWLEECACVRKAYECWSSAGSADAWLAFHFYRVALDREEHASRRFEALAA